MYYDDLPIWGFLGKVDKEGKVDKDDLLLDVTSVLLFLRYLLTVIACMLSSTIFIFILALVGVFYPYNRGVLFTALVVIYALTSGIAGYTAASFYCEKLITNGKLVLWASFCDILLSQHCRNCLSSHCSIAIWNHCGDFSDMGSGHVALNEIKSSPLILFVKDIEKSIAGNTDIYTALKSKLENLPTNIVVIGSHTQMDNHKEKSYPGSLLFTKFSFIF
ncbi:hypothetical protein F3Y22_tig00000778pilonHSYRG00420 [Hibiscus syriacus]|uniref:Transmembrane 9 superfamily member n=1 Tax=Hibiscus syriacus TaxID=106335 RepID=A0A6A3D4M0_HIBSY|nr:hypothetical protein F3Y22_tig00000778pilonHSYRG00420 [Hibiscus syriacus]